MLDDMALWLHALLQQFDVGFLCVSPYRQFSLYKESLWKNMTLQ